MSQKPSEPDSSLPHPVSERSVQRCTKCAATYVSKGACPFCSSAGTVVETQVTKQVQDNDLFKGGL